ncbi:MAG: CCA tRNA nucleotidyltransferase [Alsobacter sp.]
MSAQPVAQARLPQGSFIARSDLQRLLAVLDGEGEAARVVGGAVRNALLGLQPGDIDVATTALPQEVTRRARAAGLRSVPTGIEHGTVTVIVEGTPFEVTTLREDVDTDGRRATVVFGRDFSHDARRRDFTMNALLCDRDGVVTDHVGGLADLAAQRVRFIGDPQTRIREDYLRILRLFRFHADYGAGPLDAAAVEAAVRLRSGLERLSRERIGAEFTKLLLSRRAAETVAEVAEAGFADRILAGVADTRAFARHVEAFPAADAASRLAALAVRSAEDAPRLRERLRLSNAQTLHLEHAGRSLEALHATMPSPDERLLRRLAFRLGAGAVRDGLAITAARAGIDPRLPVAAAHAALDAASRQPPFGGARLAARGVPAGPAMGAILGRATESWLDAGCPMDDAAIDGILDAALAEA